MPKKATTPAPARRSGYELFLRSAKLYGIWLDSSMATINREQYWKSVKSKDSMTREIAAKYKAEEVEGNHFDVVAEFALKITNKADETTLLEIHCKYSAHFHTKTDCTSAAAEQFATSEGKIIVWPYFRNFVSDITARMHIPPITVPLALE